MFNLIIGNEEKRINIARKSLYLHGPRQSRKAKIGMGKMKVKKVSPPFEGGVAGTIDYMIVTRFFPGRGG
jgi:hypothetical protein